LKPARSEPRAVTRFTIPVSGGDNRSSANSLGLAIVTLSRDGQRFLMTRQIEPTASQIQVVLNWHEELKARVSVPK
jgi:hypothetical protein